MIHMRRTHGRTRSEQGSVQSYSLDMPECLMLLNTIDTSSMHSISSLLDTITHLTPGAQPGGRCSGGSRSRSSGRSRRARASVRPGSNSSERSTDGGGEKGPPQAKRACRRRNGVWGVPTFAIVKTVRTVGTRKTDGLIPFPDSLRPFASFCTPDI